MSGRRALTLLTVAIIAYGAWVFTDPGHIPLFDANIRQLAESERAGWCTGYVYWFNEAQPAQARECRETSELSDEINLKVVQRATCSGYFQRQGVIATYELLTVCEDQLKAEKFWPTMDGQLSNEWSKANPYPGSLISLTGDGSDRASDSERESDGHIVDEPFER